MKKPLFSIITTCKNSEKTIEGCIKSILNQSYPYIECIVQDGGSTDNTISILERYSGFIKIYKKTDRIADEGLISCYSKCNGSWVGTCLADEILKVNDIEKIAGILNSNSKYRTSGAIYSNCEVVNFFKKNIKRSIWKASKGFSLDLFLRRKLKIPLLATFFNKEVLIKSGIRYFNWSFDVAENEVFLRLSLLSNISYIKSSVGAYFVEGSNLSIQPNAIYLQTKGIVRLLEKNLNYKCRVPLYYRNLNLYKSKQLLYLVQKFIETESFKEAFDCYFVSLQYKVSVRDLLKILFLVIKVSKYREVCITKLLKTFYCLWKIKI